MGSEPLAIPGTSKRMFFTSKTVARKPAEKNGGVEGTKDVAVFSEDPHVKRCITDFPMQLP